MRHAHPDAQCPRFEFITGFEGTHIYGTGTDVLETTAHSRLFPEDLERMRGDRIRSFRACIPWHSVERVQGIYDWSWVDAYLAEVRQLGLNPIVDPLHHTSTPEWLTDGFADERFRDSYGRFIRALAVRYPWVTHYTVMNEPFVTLWLAGHCRIWHPYHAGHKSFVRMLINACRMIGEVTAALRSLVPGLVIVHVDTCERHTALDAAAEPRVRRSNHLRFIALDLLLGRVDATHPMRSYLSRNGATQEDLAWFRAHPATIDILGLDYYSHSERGWTKRGPGNRYEVAGFKATALEYVEHFRDYHFPIMLSETNLRGTITDRVSWLRYMVNECEKLQDVLSARGIPFLGFCWYPYIDSTDWCHLVAGKHHCRDRECAEGGHIDPQGLVQLDRSLVRHPSELSAVYARLASGTMAGSAIPAYEFSRSALVGRMVQNYLPHLTNWNWIPVAHRESEKPLEHTEPLSECVAVSGAV